MISSLIDAGPIIALFNKRDHWHERILNFISKEDYILYTTWPVLAEVSHMLSFSVKAQANVLEWVDRGGLKMISLDLKDVSRLNALMKKYSDVPMDLADASLIISGEKLAMNTIITIDSDFYIYKNIRNQYLQNILT